MPRTKHVYVFFVVTALMLFVSFLLVPNESQNTFPMAQSGVIFASPQDVHEVIRSTQESTDLERSMFIEKVRSTMREVSLEESPSSEEALPPSPLQEPESSFAVFQTASVTPVVTTATPPYELGTTTETYGDVNL